MLNKLVVTLILLLLLSCLAGCGGGGNGTLVSPPTLLFVSFRALDGSNSENLPNPLPGNPHPGQNIWAMRADNSFTPLTMFTPFPVTDFRDVVWSPDGKSIAASFNSSSQTIAIMQADGSGFTQVTNPNFFCGNSGPQWSPDSRRIAFTSACGLQPVSNEVDVINPDGSGLRTLVAATTDAAAAGWSPDGSKVLFLSPFLFDFPTTGTNIGVVTADGSSQTLLTHLTALGVNSSSPAWSPKGSQIAFVSTRAIDGSDAVNFNHTTNIWIMNADGTAARPLTTLTASLADSSSPVWSPDGSKLAFVSFRALDGTNTANPVPNIWVINPDGTGRQPLTMFTKGASAEPAWSPDGTKIAFSSDRLLDGSDATLAFPLSNIWVMQADGTGATPFTKLTALGADSDQPKWHP